RPAGRASARARRGDAGRQWRPGRVHRREDGALALGAIGPDGEGGLGGETSPPGDGRRVRCAPRAGGRWSTWAPRRKGTTEHLLSAQISGLRARQTARSAVDQQLELPSSPWWK